MKLRQRALEAYRVAEEERKRRAGELAEQERKEKRKKARERAREANEFAEKAVKAIMRTFGASSCQIQERKEGYRAAWVLVDNEFLIEVRPDWNTPWWQRQGFKFELMRKCEKCQRSYGTEIRKLADIGQALNTANLCREDEKQSEGQTRKCERGHEMDYHDGLGYALYACPKCKFIVWLGREGDLK